MARLTIYVEGQTEQTFADNVLGKHLRNLGVAVGARLIAHARKKGKVHRGGGRKYLPMKNDLVRHLKQDSSSDAYFTTMIDLYAIHADFPELAEAEKLRQQPEKRVEFLEEAFGRDIGDRRFIPYIQLHEFEALLFSDPRCFSLHCSERQIVALREIVDKTPPELIDDGKTSAPSKRILAAFPDYNKVADGPLVAELIGLEVIRGKCPHFAQWVSRLEGLGIISTKTQ
jgi:hypothetical protein